MCICSGQKNEIFMDLIERYSKTKEVDMNMIVELYGHKDSILVHLVDVGSVNNVKCAHYLLESEKIKPNNGVVSEALKIAIGFQNEDAIKLLMSYENLEEKQKEERDYGSNYLKQTQKSELLLHYLKKTCKSTNEFENIMKCLSESMIEMIKDEKWISDDVFNMCWMFIQEQQKGDQQINNKNNNNNNELWNAMLKKM